MEKIGRAQIDSDMFLLYGKIKWVEDNFFKTMFKKKYTFPKDLKCGYHMQSYANSEGRFSEGLVNKIPFLK